MAEARPKLGRGLAALLGTPAGSAAAAVPAHRQRWVPVGHLRSNPHNPRKSFNEDDLVDLAASIKARGVLQPIVVRAIGGDDETFEIIAGERRWRAAQRAGIHDVPVVVVEADDRLALELAIIENVQRADLNPAEEARGYRALMSGHGYSQGDLGQIIGKSRSHVANTLRLLALSDRVLDRLERGELSAGHARALLMLDEPEKVADEIATKGLSVRDVERLAAAAKNVPSGKSIRKIASTTDADAKELSRKLTQQSGFKIAVELRGDGGRITIDYKTLEQFDHLYKALGML